MNFGYNSTCEGWKESRKRELAYRLIPVAASYTDARNMHPYVEVDGLYDGVRIRRITHLIDEQINQLVEAADKTYEEVMNSD